MLLQKTTVIKTHAQTRQDIWIRQPTLTAYGPPGYVIVRERWKAENRGRCFTRVLSIKEEVNGRAAKFRGSRHNCFNLSRERMILLWAIDLQSRRVFVHHRNQNIAQTSVMTFLVSPSNMGSQSPRAPTETLTCIWDIGTHGETYQRPARMMCWVVGGMMRGIQYRRKESVMHSDGTYPLALKILISGKSLQ